MNGTNGRLLEVEGLTREFHVRDAAHGWRWGSRGGRKVAAVADVTFSLDSGEVVGIVGESGSGKTTLARLLLRLIGPTRGSVRLRGRDIFEMSPTEVATLVRPKARMIFQHPDAVLNPGYTVGVALAKALALHGESAESIPTRIGELLASVGLESEVASRYPDDLSGGQKRRIGICRALSTNPDVILADEALSGLDVLLQEQILGVLMHEQRRRGFALVLISHDLERANQVCDRVVVMYGGHVVEDVALKRNGTPVHDQFRHPYSVVLQRSRLDLHREEGGGFASLQGAAQRSDDTLGGEADRGCPYRSTCSLFCSLGRPGICEAEAPELREVGSGHRVACHQWSAAS